ncbi:MAG TPA: 4'-phosphopantetheinyl transferase superfamily protein [Candidatus Kryptonia bacterium]|nr:4'-phosphopantetheinyl transferase superfamily protein [Candidatus Kryptonia bacterium]
MNTSPLLRCGIDRVEVARIQRLLGAAAPDALMRIFSPQELDDAGGNGDRATNLAARFAIKEACLKLFPREAALGQIELPDFAVAQDSDGRHRVVGTRKVEQLLARYRLKPIAVSLRHDGPSVSAITVAEPAETSAPPIGRLAYHLVPIRRRVVLENLRRVFGATTSESEIVRLAQAFYAHAAQCLVEFVRFPLLPAARRAALIRVENREAILRVYEQGKGVLILAGHCGNFEVATVAGITSFPQYRGQFHILRRPLRPGWFDRLVTLRFRRAGLGVLPKKGALDAILERLAAADAVVFVLDQHAAGRDGVLVDFFGHPAWTFRSLAIISLATGVPVVPVASWREPDGSHVLRFEEALPVIDADDPDAAIRLNTRAYNAALEQLVLRHPEQWFWMHRRWKDAR